MGLHFFHNSIADGRVLTLGPISNTCAETLDPPLDSVAGYFLIENDGQNNKVLARVDDDDAALALAKLLGLSGTG